VSYKDKRGKPISYYGQQQKSVMTFNIENNQWGNPKWTIQRNWKHRVHKTKTKKPQHNMWWTQLCTSKHK